MVFDLETDKKLNIIRTQDCVNDFVYNRHRHLLAMAQDCPDIFLCDPRNREKKTLKGHKGANFTLNYISNNILVSGGDDSCIKFWDLRKSKQEMISIKCKNLQIGNLVYQ